MNILFLSLLEFESLSERNIYTDLLREFVKSGHHVYAISPIERRKRINTHIVKEKNARIIRLKIGNIQKTNVIEKGFSTIAIESQFINTIRRCFSKVKFDVVLYPTPPITLVGAVKYVKQRDGAKTYLLLKDIFPQNAVDIGVLQKKGIKGIIYRYFRNKEQELYNISDKIGCMSQANVDYVFKHNSWISKDRVEVCPNSIDPIDMSVEKATRNTLRKKYEIPLDKTVFVYGGNLGKPQGIPFLIKCIKSQEENDGAFFLIVGNGTEFHVLQEYIVSEKPKNCKLMSSLPKDEYDYMIASCDVGMIFLDYRFTIPNFPSRLLSYMQAKLPVLAVTDKNTDIGKVICEGGFGWWCESTEVESFRNIIRMIHVDELEKKGNTGFRYLLENYSARMTYEKIISDNQTKGKN